MADAAPAVYRYSEPSSGWFVAFMDELGFVCIQSDYGDYAYRWGSRGEGVGIRQFLLSCDTEYLLRKFSPNQVLDERATRNAIAEAIKEAPAHLRAAESEHLRSSSFENDVETSEWYRGTRLSDAHELVRHQAAPQAVAFFERVWPRLCRHMKLGIEGAHHG
jgi:hypothetical protein